MQTAHFLNIVILVYEYIGSLVFGWQRTCSPAPKAPPVSPNCCSSAAVSRPAGCTKEPYLGSGAAACPRQHSACQKLW
jgi:hypothetical protein